jgi:hypothetical protein
MAGSTTTPQSTAELTSLIDDLENRLANVEDKARELNVLRRRDALAAASGSDEAKRRLKAHDDDEAEFRREATSLRLALSEARPALTAARKREQADDRARKEAEAQALIEEQLAESLEVDATLRVLRDLLARRRDRGLAIHKLGVVNEMHYGDLLRPDAMGAAIVAAGLSALLPDMGGLHRPMTLGENDQLSIGRAARAAPAPEPRREAPPDDPEFLAAQMMGILPQFTEARKLNPTITASGVRQAIRASTQTMPTGTMGQPGRSAA